DVRIVRRRNEAIETRNGAVDRLSSSRDEGFGIRAIVNGAWGFASSSTISEEEGKPAPVFSGTAKALVK
ncbi:MAG: TldD/PmbA family protein, partial [Acidobacteria bacterium]|nr:TldD/PmbA family protein [Acidobacteriota bacterium]